MAGEIEKSNTFIVDKNLDALLNTINIHKPISPELMNKMAVKYGIPVVILQAILLEQSGYLRTSN